MGKRDKPIQIILRGKSNVTPEEAVKILEMLGFSASPCGGSLLTFRKASRQSVTIVLTQNPLKPYLLDKLFEALKNEGYEND